MNRHVPHCGLEPLPMRFNRFGGRLVKEFRIRGRMPIVPPFSSVLPNGTETTGHVPRFFRRFWTPSRPAPINYRHMTSG